MTRYSTVFVAFLASGCAITSDVQDAGNGNYLISGRAAPLRGGTVGAQNVAYQDANKFCAGREPGSHAVVADSSERDTYSSFVGGSFGPDGGGFSGGTSAIGNATLRFRCGQ